MNGWMDTKIDSPTFYTWGLSTPKFTTVKPVFRLLLEMLFRHVPKNDSESPTFRMSLQQLREI